MASTSFYMKWLDIKRKYYGLTPLEDYILKNHDDDKDSNPLLTYMRFVAYEKEVWDYKIKKENEQQSGNDANARGNALKAGYETSRKALLNHDLENTTYKTFLHFFSLSMVTLLMLCASAVSTYKVLDFFGDSFGAYHYLAQGFFFVTATWTQWMIYGRTAPEVLKKLFYGNPFGKTWHFTKYRELSITDEAKLTDAYADNQPSYSKAKFALFCFCSSILAISLGMILLNTADTPVEDGNVFHEMTLMHEIMQGFGGVNTVSRMLFVVYFFCNFALYVSSSLDYLFKNSIEETKRSESDQLDTTGFLGIQWSKTLVGLVTVSLFGLVGTILSQMTSTFNFISTFNDPDNPSSLNLAGDSAPPLWVLYVCLPACVLIAAGGRAIFNIKAMENVEAIIKESWACREDLWHSFKQDVRDNKGSYGLAVAGTITSLVVFGLMGGFGGNTGVQSMHATSNMSTLLPLVLSLGVSFTVWAGYKVWSRYQRETKAVSCEEINKTPTDSSPANSSTSRPFTLQQNSMKRSGQAMFAIAGNCFGAAGISGASVSSIQLYDPENKNIDPGFRPPLMGCGAAMSFGSAMRSFNVKRSTS